jgi:peptidoglycan-associated lipoprotein
MRQCNAFLCILLILALVVTVGACKKKPAETPPDTTPAETAPPPPPPPPDHREAEREWESEPIAQPEPTRDELADQINRTGVLGTIFFAYDSSELSDTALRTLRGNAEQLKANAQIDVVVEGHCDERGTIEYNLALGERRASSVRDYLTSLGVARNRIRVITYGEERPVDPGHTEAAWSKNRRAQFVAE